jgi:hypothetical protein
MSVIVIVETCALCLARKVYLTEREQRARAHNPRLQPICDACVESMRTRARSPHTAQPTLPATFRATT